MPTSWKTPPLEKSRNSESDHRGPDAANPAEWAIDRPGILDQLHEAVFTTDLQGNITGCNKGIELYGYRCDELVGRNMGVFYGPDQRALLSKTLIPTVLEKGRFEGEFRNRTKTGREIHVQMCVSLLRDRESSPVGMIGLAIDVTEKKQLQSSLQRSKPGGPETRTAKPDPVPTTRREIDGTPFIVASPLMQKFMGMVDRVAGHTETVLVSGETGTGKEFIARTIHESSHRCHRPLVDINCAALPEHLVESELFGYEKGAFSGADSSKPGLFELADKGTIFLDEIGELQTQVQVKLLRVLDKAPYYRLGGHRKIVVDVRVVAATNQDLELAVREGRFRKDLYHRLGQFQLRVPPLRERPEDILALAVHFLSLKAPEKDFSPDALLSLKSYAWPGNVRELRNLVAKLAMSSASNQIGADDVHRELSFEAPAPLTTTTVFPAADLESMEEQMIIRALEKTGGHRALAAEQLGISRRTLSRKLREYRIDVPAGEKGSPLGIISEDQQKFFRSKVAVPVTLRNSRGDECQVQAVNLSTGGMGLDGVVDPILFGGLLDVIFPLPDSEDTIHAKARLVWADAGGRAGARFVVIEPRLFERLQLWTNQKMKQEGWELPI